MIPFRVTKASERANASPTVALERGNYRMRAPSLRVKPPVFQAQPPPVRRPVNHEWNRNLTLLLFILAVAAITCFGSAYYLFASRWAYRPIPHGSSSGANTNYQVNALIPFDRKHQGQKYLSYLPHSGFHNQRIAFENALVLAYALHRTLIVPPIRLANKPIRYVEFDTLVQHHELSSKDGLQHCLQVAPYLSRPLECLEYFESTHVPWSWLIDLSTISATQSLVQIPNASQLWIREQLRLEDKDIYTLRDYSPYQFRFLDIDTDSSPAQDRYSEDIYLAKLDKVQQPLLQVGTLFGTSRLRLKNPSNLEYRRTVRHNTSFSNQRLIDVADHVSFSLGGHYISVHLRTGDGQFRNAVEQTLKSIWWKLLRHVLGFSFAATCGLERKFSGRASTECSPEPPCLGNCSRSLALPRMPPATASLKCRSPRHLEEAYVLLNTPVYVATDLPNPEAHPDLLIFRRAFPCIFFLGDFSGHLGRLDPLTSPFDGVGLKPFLLPFVDAMVAAKALRFVGTDHSTFSTYVSTLWETYRADEAPGSS